MRRRGGGGGATGGDGGDDERRSSATAKRSSRDYAANGGLATNHADFDTGADDDDDKDGSSKLNKLTLLDAVFLMGLKDSQVPSLASRLTASLCLPTHVGLSLVDPTDQLFFMLYNRDI